MIGDYMTILFPVLILVSILFGFLTGNISAVGRAAMESAQEAVKTIFSLSGTLCLWSGLMKVAEKSGITSGAVKLLSPLLRFLFSRRLPAKTLTSIAMNLSANLLGLGNAATPLGLKVMDDLQQIKTVPEDTASDEMILFTAMNASSLQLIPTTVIGLRLTCSSSNPMEILPPIWIVSLLSFTASLLAAKLFSHSTSRG